MDNPTDWDSVLQNIPVSELDISDRLIADKVDRTTLVLPGQVPTPPLSHHGSPVDDDMPYDNQTLVSVSTTFYPGAQIHSFPPDLVLLSSDRVFFYVHSHIILGSSDNGFQNTLPVVPSKDKDPLGHVLGISESSTVLNIILHTVYDMSCSHYSPMFETIIMAVDALPTYGIPIKRRIAPSTPLFSLLLSQAPLFPLEVYALAAHYDLHELAVLVSPHLLSFPLPSLSDAMAERMGPLYLKRLFFLHFGRSDALKRILLSPPHPHSPTPWCDFAEQKKLTRAWALASAYLAWDARPDLSASSMEYALSPLTEHLSCEQCQLALRERINSLVVQWSVVKRTI